MRKITKPSYNPKEVYLACISRVRDKDLSSRLEKVIKEIVIAANEFDQNAINSSFYRVQQHSNVGDIVSKDEMDSVYTMRMARKDSPGRHYYDALKAAAPLDICPLCGHRGVSQLDHYLPKAHFPSLAVLPLNLVPSCSDCNKAKLSEFPNSADSQILHPYYDDVATGQWLHAEVIEKLPAAIRFFALPPTQFEKVIIKRIHYHFDILELDKLYRSQAGVELSNIRHQLINLFSKGGEKDVSDFLTECADSRRAIHVNSWQTALYQALAQSEWFCRGGFRYIIV